MCQLEDRRRCLTQRELQVDQLSESTLIISQPVSLSGSGTVNQLVVLCLFSEEELVCREEQLQRLGEELLQKEEWLSQVQEELHVKEDEQYKKNEEVIISNCSNVLNNIHLYLQ